MRTRDISEKFPLPAHNNHFSFGSLFCICLFFLLPKRKRLRTFCIWLHNPTDTAAAAASVPEQRNKNEKSCPLQVELSILYEAILFLNCKLCRSTSIPFNVLALLALGPSYWPYCKSDPGSLRRLFSPIPTNQGIPFACLSRERLGPLAFLADSRRICKFRQSLRMNLYIGVFMFSVDDSTRIRPDGGWSTPYITLGG